MKSRTLVWISAVTVVAALAVPVRLAAQHTQYKLIDIGTLGGPASFLTDPGAGPGELVLNNAGMLAGKANTAAPDPTCSLTGNCFAYHAFRWDGGLLTDLGTLTDGIISDIASINSRGWISGNSFNGEVDPVTGGFVNHAVLWKSDQMIDLGTLGGLESLSAYVTAGGQVVGASSINSNGDPFSFWDGQIHPFIWENGVMRDLGTLGGDAGPGSSCNIQRGDLVTGTSFLNSIPNPDTHLPTAHNFLWENGKMTDLGTLGGTLVCGPLDCITCANNRGQVAGASTLAGNSVLHAFLWSQGTMTDLGTLGGSTSLIRWLNDAGEVVGGANTPNDDSFHATFWKNGRITDLGVFEGDCFSIATAINSSGRIVGSSISCDGTSRAVLWDHGSIVDLNAAIPAGSGFQLLRADNINDRGEIAGRGLPQGCGDGIACGHVFLLVPCNPRGEDCSEVAAPPGNASLATKYSISSQQGLRTSWQLLAAWRARHGQRVLLPGLLSTKRPKP